MAFRIDRTRPGSRRSPRHGHRGRPHNRDNRHAAARQPTRDRGARGYQRSHCLVHGFAGRTLWARAIEPAPVATRPESSASASLPHSPSTRPFIWKKTRFQASRRQAPNRTRRNKRRGARAISETPRVTTAICCCTTRTPCRAARTIAATPRPGTRRRQTPRRPGTRRTGGRATAPAFPFKARSG